MLNRTNILLVGNGGRENAIAWRISSSPSFTASGSKMFCTLGNPGIDKFAEPVNLNPSDVKGIVKSIKDNNIGFVVIGPEIPLSLGLADSIIQDTNAKVFGPSKAAAEIETSKVFAKNFMQKYNIPSAAFKSFDKSNYQDALSFLKSSPYPVVIKADGLAAGKGVFIAQNFEEAGYFISDITEKKIFGESGVNFVVEEFLEGFEVSVFAVTDGNDYVILPTAQDHKKIGDGDTGKNTGGMGAYAPADGLLDNKTFDDIKSKIINPALKGMSAEGRKFKGCLYCGLMMARKNEVLQPYVIEFNCRFGDPETQAVLPLIKSDFLELLYAASTGNLKQYKLEVYNKFASCIVAASGGYPDDFETGKEISGLDSLESGILVFHSGTKNVNNKILTSGGRVLSVVALSSISIDDSLNKSYNNLYRINFESIYYRKDIGKKFSQSLKNKSDNS